jgi:SulP family sulfate permease
MDLPPSRAGSQSLWRRGLDPSEWNGGLTGTLVYLAAVLTQGVIAFAALGGPGVQIGVTASLASAAVGGVVLALLARSGVPAGGPGVAVVLILAALVSRIVHDPAFDAAQPGAVRALLAVVAVCIVGAGLLQLLFAALGLASLAKFVPQPVLAGFMNGVAVLLLLAQLPPLLGLPPGAWDADGWSALQRLQPAALAVGVGAALLYGGLARRWPRLPAALLALLCATALYHALGAVWPGLAAGPTVGDIGHGLLRPDVVLPVFGGDGLALLQRHGAAVATTALVLAVIGSLETVLNLLTVDQLLDERTPPDRELAAYGAANVASGLLGGLPVALIRGRALPTLRAGGRTRVAVLVSSLLFAAVGLFGGPALQWLPVPAVAGIMVVVALMLADRWTGDLLQQWLAGERGRALRTNLAVIAVVCLVTVAWGFVAGVGIGVLLSMLLFIGSMNRTLLRSRFDARAQPSRRIYPAALEAVLAGARQSIVVMELEGALFFGTADRLAQEAQTLPADCRALVLDCRRIGTIDASGALVLAQLARQLAARRTLLLLAAVSEHNRLGRALRSAGVYTETSRPDWFDDVDRAVEAAERVLLEEAGASLSVTAVPVEDSALMRGLSPAQRQRLAELLEPVTLQPGERLFSQGDPADRMYVLTAGSLSILSEDARVAEYGGTACTSQRFVSFSPGMMLGETAMLDGAGRSAHALADTACTLLALRRSDLEDLQRCDPALAMGLYRNISLHLADRLRKASAARLAAG